METRKRANRQQCNATRKKQSEDDKANPSKQKKPLTRTNSQRSSTTAPTVETVGSDSKDKGTPRTDYNNPAKSTEQNDSQTVEGGPYVGKSSKINYEALGENFCGATPEVM